MYDGYITECPAMRDLFWQFVNLKYPDEPEEYHETSSTSLNKLNEQLHAINLYLREIVEEGLSFDSFDDLIAHILDNYPSDVDPDVLDIYLNSLEAVTNLITIAFTDNLVILDREGSVAVLKE